MRSSGEDIWKHQSKQTRVMYIPVCVFFYCLDCTAHWGREWTGQPRSARPGGGGQTAEQLPGSQIMLEFGRGGFI